MWMSFSAPARPGMRLAAFGFLAGCALLSCGLFATPAYAAAKSATYERRDYTVQIQANGDVQVTEHWQIHFTSGPFHHAFLQILMAETAGIDFGTVKGTGVTNQAVTQSTDQAGDPEREVAWDFPATTDATADFDIPYTIHSPLQLNTTQGWFDWHYFDGPAGSPLPIMHSLITVKLPTPVTTTDIHLQAFSPDGTVATSVVNGTTATAQSGATLANHALELQIAFPRAELAATLQRPVWQKNVAPADLTPSNAGTSTGTGNGATSTGSGGSSNNSSGLNFGSLIGGLLGLLMCIGLPIVIVFSLIMGAMQHSVGSSSRWIGGGRFSGPYNRGPWGGYPPFGGGGFGGGGGSMGGGGMGGGGGASGGAGGGGGGSGFS